MSESGHSRRCRAVWHRSALPPIATIARTSPNGRFGRVEDGRGSLSHAATLRFPSPLIEPDVRISRIRLSDWLHRQAHREELTPQAASARRALFLRLSIQLSLKDPDHSRCCQAHRQSPSPRLLRKRARSQGPLLRRHYPASTLVRPCPTPALAAACRDVEAATLALTGLPRLPEPPFRRAVPTTPADRAGARVDCFPARAAFPKWQEGRHPHCHFRGLLRLHSRYGPPDCSAAHRRPLSRGSSPCSYPHEPLVSYRINRQLSGWIPPPLVIRAFGAHCHKRTHAVQQKRPIRSPCRQRQASFAARRGRASSRY
jgi:hypothetical protein